VLDEITNDIAVVGHTDAVQFENAGEILHHVSGEIVLSQMG